MDQHDYMRLLQNAVQQQYQQGIGTALGGLGVYQSLSSQPQGYAPVPKEDNRQLLLLVEEDI